MLAQRHCEEGDPGPDRTHHSVAGCLLPFHELVRGKGELDARAEREVCGDLCGEKNEVKISCSLYPKSQVSCCWWLPAQAVNFKYVPPKYRIVYNGACGFVWASILCAIKRGKDA